MPKIKKVTEILAGKLRREGLVPPLRKKDAGRVAKFLKRITGLDVYPESVAVSDGTGVCIGRAKLDKFLVVFGDTIGFKGKPAGNGVFDVLV